MLWLLTIACLRLPEPAPVEDTDVDSPVDTDEPVDTTPIEPAPIPCTRPNLEAVLATYATWPITASCGHLWFSAHNAGRSLGVQVYLETRDRTFTPGQVYDIDFAAPGADNGALQLHEGESLQPVCGLLTDTGDDPVPSATWRAVKGTAAFTVDGPSARGDGAFMGHLDLRGVVVEFVGIIDSQCALPDATWGELELGWYSGD